MSLKNDIKPFIDGNGLVSPQLAVPGQTRMSDNGIMFSSEYYILLADNKMLTNEDKLDYIKLIQACSVEPGLIARAPGFKQGGPPPDDMYAVAAASKVLNIPEIAGLVASYGDSNGWIFNADNPRVLDRESFLGRQIPLVCALYTAAGMASSSFVRFITATTIATSCIGAKPSDTDARRLAYHLVQTVDGSGWFINWACNVWWNRLRKDYGDEGMRNVALIYYQNDHPFRKYWKNKWEL